MSEELDFTRRKFLKATGVVAGAVALSGTVIPVITAEAQAADTAHQMSNSAGSGDRAFIGRMFFTNALEFSTLSEAAERIFPKDATGPGAIELSVPFFIDNQLAGAFGYQAREYTMGPFFVGAPTQGHQMATLKRDLFLEGLAGLNRQSNETFKKNFPDLSDAQKDQILKMCEAGQIPMSGFTSAYFFAVLRAAVLAGAFADPIYNGNSGMNGWKMKKFPGARMAYLDIIDSTKFQNIAPVSLADMH